MSLLTDIESLINRHSRENVSGTPDFILANYLQAALDNFEATVKARDSWWGFVPMIGGTVPAADTPVPEGECERCGRPWAEHPGEPGRRRCDVPLPVLRQREPEDLTE